MRSAGIGGAVRIHAQDACVETTSVIIDVHGVAAGGTLTLDTGRLLSSGMLTPRGCACAQPGGEEHLDLVDAQLDASSATLTHEADDQQAQHTRDYQFRFNKL